MANLDQPIGFRPAMGIQNQHVYFTFPVDVGNATALFVGDVMDFDGTAVIPAAADAGDSAVGVCTGILDSNGVPIGHPNSSVSTKYLPTTTAGFAIVALAVPGAIFVCQADDDTALSSSHIGATGDHSAGAGDTVTAVSRHELDASNVGTGLQFRILERVREPNNAWGTNTDVYVVFNESALGCAGKATV